MKQRIFIWLLWLLTCPLAGQVPFDCDGQVYALDQGSTALNTLFINPSNNALSYTLVEPDLGVSFNAIGFRRSDRLIYGIKEGTTEMHRIDASGTSTFMSTLNLDGNLDYLAGDFSSDGNTLTLVGSDATGDQRLYFVDLASSDFTVQSIGMSGNTLIKDIANKPNTKLWYGYDAKTRSVLFINEDDAVLTGLSILEGKDEVESVFFDPFGKLYGIGSTAFGIAHALFEIDQNTGVLKQLTTGPQTFIRDATTCSWTVDMTLGANTNLALPCSDLEYELKIANASGVTFEDLDLELELPVGIEYTSLLSNGFNQTAQYNAGSRTLRINNFSLLEGITNLRFSAEIGNTTEGKYRMQALVEGLPQTFGGKLLSDDPRSNSFNDAVAVELIRPVEDSVFVRQLLCEGETATLDAAEYGNGLIWDNGSEESTRPVSATGIYTLESENDCLEIYVEFDVTEATCPYTLEMLHEVDPPEFFPCSQVVFRYILDNDSGFKHRRLLFKDRLPDQFTLVELVKAPFGHIQVDNGDPQLIEIKEVEMRVGLDTIEILVEIGNEPPQTIYNRALISGFPVILGPMRASDDPLTNEFDSTAMLVLGTLEDTMTVDRKVCRGEDLILDGTDFGTEFLWENGSVDSIFSINQPGVYELTVFDGCDPSTVLFDVKWGKEIEISLDPELEIHLGDSIKLQPSISNLGDSLFYSWSSIDLDALACDSCLSTYVRPFDDIHYLFKAENEECRDSVEVLIKVDKTRRIYFPNTFSPNGDLVNDYFFLQSPDYGLVNSFEVYDRWGNRVFSKKKFFMNDELEGWDGSGMPVGTYAYVARITFIDKIEEIFSGEIVISK